MPTLAHSLKCRPVVIVPFVRVSFRTLQNCWKVLVPSILGLFVRVLV
jgi:hypothetical protein